MFKHILVATDGSPAADKAVALALQLADKARVTALMVAPDYGTAQFAKAVFLNRPEPRRLRSELAAAGRAKLDQVLARHGAKAERVQRVVVVNDRAYEAIVSVAERRKCDLIVMASRGRKALKSALLGSQTLKVLSLSKVPVLVAH